MMRRLALLLASLLLGLLAAAPAFAHEIRPAYLQIREIDANTYDLLWKTPAQGDMRLALNVELPPACADLSPMRTTPVDGAVVQRWRSKCEGGLIGKEIGIENLEASLTDVIVRFEPASGPPRTLRLNGAAPHALIPAQQAWGEVAGTYFRLGVEHILFGFDHLLFVLCLLILVNDLKRLLGAITAFTAAHSITLAGTTFGWLHLSSAPVEASIALSIAFVAAEIIRSREGHPSITKRWPWLASFSFGLLHGFGFASALREIGLPDGAVPLALLFFNLGVEAGQILFVAACLMVFALYKFVVRRLSACGAFKAPDWLWRVPPYAAGTVAGFWVIERTAKIFFS